MPKIPGWSRVEPFGPDNDPSVVSWEHDDTRVRVTVHPSDHGRWAVSVLRGNRQAGVALQFGTKEGAMGHAREYLRENPEGDMLSPSSVESEYYPDWSGLDQI